MSSLKPETWHLSSPTCMEVEMRNRGSLVIVWVLCLAGWAWAAGDWTVSEPQQGQRGSPVQTVFLSLPPGRFRSHFANEGPGAVLLRMHLRNDGQIVKHVNPGSSIDIDLCDVYQVDVVLEYAAHDGKQESASGTY